MASSDTIFFPVAILTIFSLINTSQQLSYRMHLCYNTTGNYAANSAFPANLNFTLSSLYTNGTFDSGFYNTSTGQTPDRASGIFQCRVDLSPGECQSCVKATSEDIIRRCPNQKEAILWYDECMLRYSNRSIFSKMEKDPRGFLWNPSDTANPDAFNKSLEILISSLVRRAVSGSSNNMFAVGEVEATSFNNIYGLMQCTPDISQDECSQCLNEAITDIPRCCSGKKGGRVLMPSCNLRYESYRFFEPMATAPAPAPLLASSPPSQPPWQPPSIDPPNSLRKAKMSLQIIVAIVVSVVFVAVVFSILCFCFLRERARKKCNPIREKNDYAAEDEITTVRSLQFELGIIQVATDSFSEDNKIGEGGFGCVYKGTLPDGQEIAVKRLSKRSGQGAEQFRNEVLLVAGLQHKNLVRLLGFCIHGEEKILIYEFVPNKSLDYFLSDPEKKEQLDWSKRYNIMRGIAWGILYLHEDSRLRIIHRDLKAGNILLDTEMNPKISDFGLARLFGGDQTHEATNIIAGTRGYMPPEYALRGQFSVKSDVFSLGVLFLEIISGQMISSFNNADDATDLRTYAWKHFTDGTPLEIMDPILRASYSRNEVVQCIHISLLCTQKDPADRPTMASLVGMLNSASATLPLPQQPGFFFSSQPNITTNHEDESNQSSSHPKQASVNEASMTEPYAR